MKTFVRDARQFAGTRLINPLPEINTMSALTALPTLAETVWPGTSRMRQILLLLLGTLALWASARAQVTIGPVPVTLQTLVVLAIGTSFGARLGAATVAAYLAEGALGLPVFAHGGGLAYMAGPTGGYLAGFVPAAAVAGFLAGRGFDRSALKMFAAMVLASALIYVPGAGWLATFTGIEKAISLGVVPFLAGDIIKAALAAALFPALWQITGRFTGRA